MVRGDENAACQTAVPSLPPIGTASILSNFQPHFADPSTSQVRFFKNWQCALGVDGLPSAEADFIHDIWMRLTGLNEQVERHAATYKADSRPGASCLVALCKGE